MGDFASSTTHEWFGHIFELDVSPQVFDVNLKRSSASEGYEVIIAFRRPHAPGLDYISCRGDSPELALSAAYSTLNANFGKCIHCGGYRSPQ